jgi:large repetitive protein
LTGAAGLNRQIDFRGFKMLQALLLIIISACVFWGASGLATAADRKATVIADMPPRADAGTDFAALIGEPVVFDGSKSADDDGNILNYHWNFGDGTRAIGITPRHVFWHPGTYHVKLLVRDDSGRPANVHTDEVVVTIKTPPNVTPRAHIAISGSVLTRVGIPIMFDGSKSSDGDGNILLYDWDFGNGAKARGVAPVYTYQVPGQYIVTLLVMDDYENPGGTHKTQFTLTIKPGATAVKEKD